jgi:hypothetical protein
MYPERGTLRASLRSTGRSRSRSLLVESCWLMPCAAGVPGSTWQRMQSAGQRRRPALPGGNTVVRASSEAIAEAKEVN